MLSLIYWLAYISILFPYTSIIFVGTDVSPMYIFFLFFLFIYIIFYQQIKLTKNLKILYISFYIFISFGILSIISGIILDRFVMLRYGAGYILFPYIFFAFYHSGQVLAIKNYNKYMYKLKSILIYSLYIWLFFGLLQLFFKVQGSYLGFEISNYFVTSDISHRVSMSRGILSLAVEPSYLGLTSCIFISFVYFLDKLNYLTKKESKKMYIILFFLVIASMSIVSFLALFFLLISIIISERNLKSLYLILLFLLSIIFIYFNFIDYFSNTRLISIASKIIENPSFLIIDLSSASRAAAIIAPQMSLGLNDIWTGFLLSEQNKTLIEAVSILNNDSSYYLTLGVENSAKIKSTFGVFVFQYGLFGIISLAIFYYAILNLFRGYNWYILPYLSMVSIAYLIQVPLTYPLIPGVMAIMVIIINKDKFKRRNNNV